MRIGKDVVINLGAKVKHAWRRNIGEHVRIDNLAKETIRTNSFISQGAYLCTGSHDWSIAAFRLVTRPITPKGACWVGAKACLAPGTFMKRGAVMIIGSVGRGRLRCWHVLAGAETSSRIKRRERPAKEHGSLRRT